MRPAFTAQALAVADDRRLAGAVSAVARQAADAGHAGHPHQHTPAALAHRLDKGLEGGRHAQVVGLEGGAQHLQIGRIGGVDAHADAGIGDHHGGQALALQAVAAGTGDGRHIAHIGRVDLAAVGVEALGLGPGAKLIAAPRHQGQRPARAVVAQRQRLANAAGRTGDEHQRPAGSGGIFWKTHGLSLAPACSTARTGPSSVRRRSRWS